MSRVLIIGYGNPLRRDDGFGCHVAQQLETYWTSPEIEIVACHQLTPELAEPLSWADYAVFVDAAEQNPPGELCFDHVAPAQDGFGAFSHHVSAAALLANAESLFGSHPMESFLVSVNGSDFGFGEGMSECVERQLPIAIEGINQLISEWTLEAASFSRTNLQSPFSTSGAKYA